MDKYGIAIFDSLAPDVTVVGPFDSLPEAKASIDSAVIGYFRGLRASGTDHGAVSSKLFTITGKLAEALEANPDRTLGELFVEYGKAAPTEKNG